MSNDVVAVISLLASFAMLQLMAGGMVEQLSQFMRACIYRGQRAGGRGRQRGRLGLARQGSGVMLRVVGPDCRRVRSERHCRYAGADQAAGHG